MVLVVDLRWTCCKGRSRRQAMRRCQERPLPSHAYKDWCLANSDRILRIHPIWEALDRAAREDKPLLVRHLAGSGRLRRQDTRRLGIDAHEISRLRRSLRYGPVVGTSRVGRPVAAFRRRRDAAAAQSSLQLLARFSELRCPSRSECRLTPAVSRRPHAPTHAWVHAGAGGGRLPRFVWHHSVKRSADNSWSRVYGQAAGKVSAGSPISTAARSTAL
jgi:hypothetical protein